MHHRHKMARATIKKKKLHTERGTYTRIHLCVSWVKGIDILRVSLRKNTNSLSNECLRVKHTTDWNPEQSLTKWLLCWIYTWRGNAPHCCGRGLEESVCTLVLFTLWKAVHVSRFYSTLSVAKTKKQTSEVCMYQKDTELCVYHAQIKQWMT